MNNENHELLIELWSRLRSHISPKERLEVADTMVVVFDDFGLIEDSILEEDLDKELRAAVRSYFEPSVDEFEYEDFDDEPGY